MRNCINCSNSDRCPKWKGKEVNIRHFSTYTLITDTKLELHRLKTGNFALDCHKFKIKKEKIKNG